jgi:hypothetical protein
MVATKKRARKTPAKTVSKTAVIAKVASPRMTFEELPLIVQKSALAWSPRVTRYVRASEIGPYLKDPTFSAQTPLNFPGDTPSHVFGPFTIQEVGSLTIRIGEENSRDNAVKDVRLVKVIEK